MGIDDGFAREILEDGTLGPQRVSPKSLAAIQAELVQLIERVSHLEEREGVRHES